MDFPNTYPNISRIADGVLRLTFRTLGVVPELCKYVLFVPILKDTMIRKTAFRSTAPSLQKTRFHIATHCP